MSIITKASGIMGIVPENDLILLQKVHVGKAGVNYLFKVDNPHLEVGNAYDFNFQIDRRKALKVSYTEDGHGEFALFGHYKNTTRKITEGTFRYLLHKDAIKLMLRVPLTDKVDIEFIEQASFEFIVKGLEESEPLSYLGVEVKPLSSVLGTPSGE